MVDITYIKQQTFWVLVRNGNVGLAQQLTLSSYKYKNITSEGFLITLALSWPNSSCNLIQCMIHGCHMEYVCILCDTHGSLHCTLDINFHLSRANHFATTCTMTFILSCYCQDSGEHHTASH